MHFVKHTIFYLQFENRTNIEDTFDCKYSIIILNKIYIKIWVFSEREREKNTNILGDLKQRLSLLNVKAFAFNPCQYNSHAQLIFYAHFFWIFALYFAWYVTL